MNKFWQERNERERLLLGAAAALCVMLGFYQFAWVPARDYRDDAAARLASAEAMYQEVANGVEVFARLQADAVTSDERSLRVLASMSAADLGLGITRLQPADNGDLSLWFDAADAKMLWRWAIRLRRQHGVAFVKASMQRAPDQAAVRAQFLLRKQSKAG